MAEFTGVFTNADDTASGFGDRLWKNADPDIPILKEAKAEYAKLP